jgi:hypothetical protein
VSSCSCMMQARLEENSVSGSNMQKAAGTILYAAALESSARAGYDAAASLISGWKEGSGINVPRGARMRVRTNCNVRASNKTARRINSVIQAANCEYMRYRPRSAARMPAAAACIRGQPSACPPPPPSPPSPSSRLASAVALRARKRAACFASLYLQRRVCQRAALRACVSSRTSLSTATSCTLFCCCIPHESISGKLQA